MAEAPVRDPPCQAGAGPDQRPVAVGAAADVAQPLGPVEAADHEALGRVAEDRGAGAQPARGGGLGGRGGGHEKEEHQREDGDAHQRVSRTVRTTLTWLRLRSLAPIETRTRWPTAERRRARSFPTAPKLVT